MADEAHPADGRHDDELIFPNGVDGATGRYLLPPLAPKQVVALARGESLDALHIEELKLAHEQATQGTFGPRAGIDPKNLAETGWAVLFAHDADPAIREALAELLAFRRTQAGRIKECYYREFAGPDGYRPGESHRQFLARHGTSPGMPADPKQVPYYLLIVGDPETIPYSFQYQLDVMHATGRLHFDRLEEYERYARGVVAVERGEVALPRRAAFFGPRNSDDRATQLSAEYLVQPLAAKLTADHPEWQVQALLGAEATKARLSSLLGGPETPALLFTASHGLGFPADDPRQPLHQGALLCQDWPGPLVDEPIPPEHYFSADDLTDAARLLGLISVHFACYGAGTPRFDEFSHGGSSARATVAERAFVASLPRRLLSHPSGGALATVGHVERAWGYSFHSPRVGQQTQVFEDFFTQLLAGHPVGSALDCFNLRYASLAAELSETLKDMNFGKRVDDLVVANMWTANNDARNYVILGDPAVRLPVADRQNGQTERPTITPLVRDSNGLSTDVSKSASPPSAPPLAPPAGPPPEAGSASPLETAGLFDQPALKEACAALSSGLERFAIALGQTLDQLADEAMNVEIRTYVSDDLPGVRYADGELTGPARLRAFTRLSASGDTIVCLPEDDGQLDQQLWSRHLQMVQQAQTSRAELLKSLTSAATDLLSILRQRSC